jgi:hypothetical protein
VREAKAEATRTTVDPEPGEGTRPPRHARHSPPSSHCPRRFLPPTTFVTANSCAEFLRDLEFVRRVQLGAKCSAI